MASRLSYMIDSPFTTQPLIEVTTVGDLLLGAARQWPNNQLLHVDEHCISYVEMSDRAITKARALQGMGVKAGDHVGILAPNLVEVIEMLFAISLSGAVGVLLNARYKATELTYVIENADLKWLFTTDRASEHVSYIQLLYDALDGLSTAEDPFSLSLPSAPKLNGIVLMEQTSPRGFLNDGQFQQFATLVTQQDAWRRRSEVKLSDPCLMMYTSGTTSLPKGCRISHESLVRTAIGAASRFTLTEDDRMWNPLPMFHMGFILPFLAMLYRGGHSISSIHFEAGASINVIEKENVSFLFVAFPTIMSALLNHQNFSLDKFAKVRLINNVGAPDQLKNNMTAIPNAVHVTAYGSTEVSGVVGFSHPEDNSDIRAHRAGRPFAGIRVKIVNPETAQEVVPEEHGEIIVAGYSVFEGYYKSPEKDAEAFDEDGWFHTGDIGSMDTLGRIAYHGRLKDMLKVGGENVAAVEIESYLSKHPAVALVQVVGVPDDKLLEVAAAFVELKPGVRCTEEELIGFCKNQIASFKVPRYIRFVDEWPMSSTKIQKYRLRDDLVDELAPNR
ncbi:MAG: fatty-acyl-CoA synthase [Halieaceae bacterium]|jgi:fatty-acyl-CoA synthase